MKHNFKKLKVWEKAIDFADNMYDYCSMLPNDERFNLQSQLKRASVSIPSNIAEGSAKRTSKEFAHYLGISLGSSYEVETQLIICERRKFSIEKTQDLLNQIAELQKMIFSFRKSLTS